MHAKRIAFALVLMFVGGVCLAQSCGGTVVTDRLCFFGTAERNQPRVVSALPQTSPKIDANWNAALGSRNSFSASFLSATIPSSSSFMTLHYTGIVSSNMFVTGSVTHN